ncbi:hypothetical protein ACROYT_G015280 [Oculina patagonica]
MKNRRGCIQRVKKYISLLNPKQKAFFQKTKPKVSNGDDIWYENKPIASNKLSSMMKEISLGDGFSKTYTNHCVCATAITMWSDAKLPGNISGDANEQSLTSFNMRLSVNQLEKCSDILSSALKTPERRVQQDVQQRAVTQTSTSSCSTLAASYAVMFSASTSNTALPNAIFHRCTIGNANVFILNQNDEASAEGSIAVTSPRVTENNVATQTPRLTQNVAVQTMPMTPKHSANDEVSLIKLQLEERSRACDILTTKVEELHEDNHLAAEKHLLVSKKIFQVAENPPSTCRIIDESADLHTIDTEALSRLHEVLQPISPVVPNVEPQHSASSSPGPSGPIIDELNKSCVTPRKVAPVCQALEVLIFTKFPVTPGKDELKCCREEFIHTLDESMVRKLCIRSLRRGVGSMDYIHGLLIMEDDLEDEPSNSSDITPTPGTSTGEQLTSVEGTPGPTPPSGSSTVPWCKCGMCQIKSNHATGH